MNSDAQDLTVVICCYSAKRFFKDAVSSVLAQDFQEYRLVFYDNGSSQDYRNLIVSVAMETGAQVIRTEVNCYGEGLRADVLPMLHTRYVAILHDDDMYEPGKLRRAMALLEAENLDYLFTDRQYVDAENHPLSDSYDEVNTAPFGDRDLPYQFIADIFYRGLRFHFSTFVCTTSLAQLTGLGDPFLPRIADSLFAARLMLDLRFKGRALPDKTTLVRVHGGNDMLYDKFAPEDRGREMTLLSWSEYFIFSQLVAKCQDGQLAGVFRIFPGIKVKDPSDRTDILTRAALELSKLTRSKKLMAALCLHTAFEREPYRTMQKVRSLTGSDLNSLMSKLYQEYTRGEVVVYRNFMEVQATEASLAQEAELRRLSAKIGDLAPVQSTGLSLLAQLDQLGASLDGMRSALMATEDGQVHAVTMVTNAYRDLMGREARPEEMLEWRRAIARGATFTDLRSAILATETGRAHISNVIVQTYRDYMGRDPQADEVEVWLGSIAEGRGQNDMRSEIASAEEAGRHLAVAIGRAYWDLIGRDAEDYEIERWRGAMGRGSTLIDLRSAIIATDEGRVHTAGVIAEQYRSYFGRDPTEGDVEVWRGTWAGGGTISDLSDVLATLSTFESVHLLNGGSGVNNFSFSSKSGHLVIYRFYPDADHISVSTPARFDPLASAVEARGPNGEIDVLITFDVDNTILLKNVRLASLTRRNFG